MTKRNSHFLRGLLIYALIYAVIAGAALGVFWKFIEAYELSRPLTAVNSFIADLTSQDIRVGAEVLVNTVDGNIQSPDQAFAVIEENISGPITAAKSGKESTSDRAVYKLRNNGHIIGSVAIVPGEKGSFDFTPWVVAETQFDFSWLLREKMSITVPAECSVSLNGNVLNKSYITEADICYPVLEDFAGDFPMPTLVTYTAGDILGDFPFVVTNAEGEALDITPETDLNSLLPQCTTEEEAQLQKLTSDFLTAYINYTGSANRMAYANLSRLKQYVVKDGALSQRLSAAFGGLIYAQSNGDEITSTTIHGIYPVGEDRYCCDVSYVLKTIGHNGAVETNNSTRLIILTTEEGLKVEAMANY